MNPRKEYAIMPDPAEGLVMVAVPERLARRWRQSKDTDSAAAHRGVSPKEAAYIIATVTASYNAGRKALRARLKQ